MAVVTRGIAVGAVSAAVLCLLSLPCVGAFSWPWNAVGDKFWPKNLKDWSSSASSIVTFLGVLVAAWWFVWRRQTFPRAKATHEFWSVRLKTGEWLVHISVKVQNVGGIALRLREAFLRVQQLMPFSWDPAAAEKLPWDKTELQWPSLYSSPKREWSRNACLIEPGEEQEICYDAIINGDAEVVVVYSFHRNSKRLFRELGWPLTTVHSLKEEAMGERRDLMGQAEPKPEPPKAEAKPTSGELQPLQPAPRPEPPARQVSPKSEPVEKQTPPKALPPPPPPRKD